MTSIVAGGGELGAGHGAGAVENDGEVEGDPVVRRAGFAFQLEQGAHNEALLHDGELVIDEDLGFACSAPIEDARMV